MTLLECLAARFGDFDADTKCKHTTSTTEGEIETETLVFTQGPRRPPITIIIKKHITT
jgi:hypothetical protein